MLQVPISMKIDKLKGSTLFLIIFLTFMVEAIASPPRRVIHVLVALCDNQYQGIVPVPPRIGNGDDPTNNLYWGAAYGVKSFFKKSTEWKLIAEMQKPKPEILERLVFKHLSQDVYLVADAYRGREIKKSIRDFFAFAAGRNTDTITVPIGSHQTNLQIGGHAELIAYIGHDGLMDFSLDAYPKNSGEKDREVVILACASKNYFVKPLRET